MTTAKMIQRIGPEHESRHEADDDPDYNESSYYNFADPRSGVVGWVRVGLQHNRRAAQAGVLIFLPSGETVFATENVETDQTDSLAAGPLLFEILYPHRVQRLRWNWPVTVFTDARDLTDPRSAFAEASREPLRLDLTSRGRGDSFGADGETRVLEEKMARGHYEQFVRVAGTLELDGQPIEVAGAGLRDHSWGPRDWTGPLSYRWITAFFDDDTQLMLLLVNGRDGTTTREAKEWRDGEIREVTLEAIDETWTDDGFLREVSCDIITDGGRETLTATIRDQRQLTPLRHRRPDGAGGELVTRIGYGPYQFRRGSRAGTGIVEGLDQLIDGLPISMSADLP